MAGSLAASFALVLTGASTNQMAYAASPATYGYSAYTRLSPYFPSAMPQVSKSSYCRTALNGYDHTVSATMAVMGGRFGKRVTFAAGQTKTVCVKLAKSARAHYNLIVHVDSEIDRSAGVWTPKFGTWYRPKASNPYFVACSTNPLNKKAVYNAQSAPIGKHFRLMDYTHGYIKPGGYACMKFQIPKGKYRIVKISWNTRTTHYIDGVELSFWL